jgi:hypothetical protein
MSLPADVWRLIAHRADRATLQALRGTSAEARRGAANQHEARATVAAAYRSATARAVRPLVAALRSPRGASPRTVVVGRYRLTVLVNQTYQVVSVVWESDGNWDLPRLVGWYDLLGSTLGEPTRQEITAMGPGAATAVRLVRAAFKAAF